LCHGKAELESDFPVFTGTLFEIIYLNSDIYLIDPGMLHTLFYITLFFFLPAPPPSPLAGTTKLQYIVIQDDKKIGTIDAVANAHGDVVIYDVDMKMNPKILFTQRVKYSSRAVYKHGQLQNSSAASYVNDKQHHTCATTWKGNRYDIRREKDAFSLKRAIAYSGVMLYFREPAGVATVYSEMSGQDNSIRRSGDRYILTDSRTKKQNQYWYKAGILDHASLNHALVDIQIKRVR
jgi:hypothetical protein